MSRRKCSCHGYPTEKKCPECGKTLVLIHIPDYGDHGLPNYGHLVAVGTLEELFTEKGSKRIFKTLEHAAEKCKYKEYPLGQPPKEWKCIFCGTAKREGESIESFRRKHKKHTIGQYWVRGAPESSWIQDVQVQAKNS